MVQLFYYENRGKCCRKLWKHDGNKLKVYLHAEESWAETALASYWVIKPSPWWVGLSQKWRGRPRKFVVEEHMGSKVRTGRAVMIDNGPQGVLWVRGAFNRKDKSIPSPYFKLTLTSHVSPEDFQLGYSMTGLVERSSNKYVNFQTTHLAFVRRSQSQQSQNQDKLNLFHGDDFHQDLPNKQATKHLNSFLTNIELSKMMLSNNTGHHSLDNQMYHSAHRLKRSLSNKRCDSTSSDSSTSTLVEDPPDLENENAREFSRGLTNSISKIKEQEHDLILVLPLESESNSVKDDNKRKTITSTKTLSTLTNKKCCPVQCIDSMSMVSSICPTPSSSSTCPPFSSQPISNCFEKNQPLPFSKKSLTDTKYETEEVKTNPTKSTKRNFSQYIIPSTSQSQNGLKDFKDSSKEKSVKSDVSNKVQKSSMASSPRVHQLINKPPFKEWLL